MTYRLNRASSGPDLGSFPSARGATEIDDRSELPSGYIVGGKYQIDKIVGRGGMGSVYAAQHLTLQEPVAIKVLRPSMMGVSGMITRFMREARAASKIRSPYVCRVTDVDLLPSGIPYMVMEHLEGIDLAVLRRKVGPLDVTEAATYIVQACDAIAEAHELGIIHRDLKPSNLFLAQRRDERRSIKVLDFGISKVDNPTEEDATKPGIMMGSPKYMSPEQMRSIHDVDRRTDIWALGAILYDLLAGRPPFVADNMAQVCTMVLHGEPPSLRSLRPEVPVELEQIVERCLKKKPEDRFATADELAQVLSPFYDAADASGPVSTRLIEPLPSEPESGRDKHRRETAPTLDLEEMKKQVDQAKKALAKAQPGSSDTPQRASVPSRSTSIPPRKRSRPLMAVLIIGAAAIGVAAGVVLGGGLLRSQTPPKSPANVEEERPAEVTVVSTTMTDPMIPSADPAVPSADPAASSADPTSAVAPSSSVQSNATATPTAATTRPAGAQPAPWRPPSKDPFGGQRN